MANRRLRWLLLLALGCRRGDSGKAAAADPPPAEKAGDEESGPKLVKVQCALVSQQPLHDQVELHGTVAPLPDRDAMVAPQVAGRLAKVLVREGDAVKEGQPLALVEVGPLTDQLHEAEALLAKAVAEEQNARVTLERVERVFARGIAARQEVDDAQARAAQARAAQAQATAATRRAQRQLEFATVRSPLPGLVLRVLRRSGELVDGTAATAVVEVGDPAQLELLAAAAAADLVQLRRGALATVQFSALPGGRWAGSVAAVAPAVDRQSGLGRVRLTLAIGEGPAPPVGLYGTAQIAIGTPRLGLLVPLPALRSRSDKEAELVVCGSDGVAHVRRVQLGSARALGKSGDSLIEVRSVGGPALAVGDRVAVEPVLGIGDGDKLELTPAGSSDGSSDGGSHD